MEKFLIWERVGGGGDFKDIYKREVLVWIGVGLDLDVVIGDGGRQLGEEGVV